MDSYSLDQIRETVLGILTDFSTKKIFNRFLANWRLKVLERIKKLHDTLLANWELNVSKIAAVISISLGLEVCVITWLWEKFWQKGYHICSLLSTEKKKKQIRNCAENINTVVMRTSICKWFFRVGVRAF